MGLLNVVLVAHERLLRVNGRGERGQLTQRLIHGFNPHLLVANVAGSGDEQGAIDIKHDDFTVRKRSNAGAERSRQRL